MLLARRAKALKRHLAAAAAGEVRSIHHARVASRRLREAVPVLAAGLERRSAAKARKRIRRLTRALGGLRELQVSLALVDELAARGTLPRLPLEHLRAHILEHRDARDTAVTKHLAKAKIAKLEHRLARLREALRTEEGAEWKHALARRLMARAASLERAVQHAGQLYEPERLHRVRLAVKKLRYALELAADAGAAGVRPGIRTLKRAQDILGRLHDLHVLELHIAAVLADTTRVSVPDAGFEMVSAAVEEECRHLHARYLSAAPSLLEAVEVARTSVGPQLLPRLPRRRPLKMDLASSRRPARRTLPHAGQRS